MREILLETYKNELIKIKEILERDDAKLLFVVMVLTGDFAGNDIIQNFLPVLNEKIHFVEMGNSDEFYKEDPICFKNMLDNFKEIILASYGKISGNSDFYLKKKNLLERLFVSVDYTITNYDRVLSSVKDIYSVTFTNS